MKRPVIVLVLGLMYCILHSSLGWANEVNRWNDITLNAIRNSRLPPPLAARLLVMVHLAIFDAVNAPEKKYESYTQDYEADPGMVVDMAVAAAARRVLSSSLPTQKYAFERAFAETLKRLSVHGDLNQSISLGESTAKNILNLRKDDLNFAAPAVDYEARPARGTWIPTFPSYESPLLPEWRKVRPFILASGSQFRPGPPPALESEEYQKDLAEVRELGSKDSATRTLEQTLIAKFWADGPGTSTPAGHFNLLARQLSQTQGLDLLATARMLALLNLALADGAIACWDTKYEYWFWRPVTALGEAEGEEGWKPLLFTPYFPEYVSGHSTFAGAAYQVLSTLFGTDHIPFSLSADGMPEVTRHFNRLSEAAHEAGRSRVYGGIHFEFSNQRGQALGRAVGSYVLQQALRPR